MAMTRRVATRTFQTIQLDSQITMSIRTWFCNLSIKNKLSAIIMLISLVLISLISGSLIANEHANLKRNLSADLMTLADIIASNGSIGLVFGDVQASQDTLASLKAKPNITQARFFDETGKLFTAYFRHNYTVSDSHKNQTNLREFYFAYAHHESESKQMTDRAFFENDHVDVFKSIILKGENIGTVYIQSDLKEITQRLRHYAQVVAIISLASLLLALLLAHYLQGIITGPVLHLMNTVDAVTEQNNYALRAQKKNNDEIGRLIHGFNRMLSTIQERNQEIHALNTQLKEENQRMSAELEITQRLQKMVLPKQWELEQFDDLDIACFMEPADEVGGDYYDILYCDGHVKIGIGDVTGHGLESGVVMLMVQMAVRTLLVNKVADASLFLNVLNEALYYNVQRMECDKNLTLAFLDYRQGEVRISGQHEDVLKISCDGQIQAIDTTDLGFMVGLLNDIARFINEIHIHLEPGEGIVLYTDGLTEARNPEGEMFGLSRLCDAISRHWPKADAKHVEVGVLTDFEAFVAGEKLVDDVTLLVLRRIAARNG
jgi:prepilin-type processing-associated H-X9-DG protein